MKNNKMKKIKKTKKWQKKQLKQKKKKKKKKFQLKLISQLTVNNFQTELKKKKIK